jgi:GNAT superfamily N-acetyltransferase
MDIHYLADYPHHTEQIAQWNLDEWPSIYDGSLEKAVAYHAATATRGGVPTCLVATENNILLGVVCILMDDLENRPDLNPWLGALYVNPEFRGRGIARKLVEACMNEARKAQLDILYAWTKHLTPLFKSLGWNHIETVDALGSPVDVLALTISGK